MLEFNFNWQKLSVSAGLTLRNFYFRLYPGAIGELEVIDFLKALVRHIDGPLLIVWDRLPAHRSRLVREFIELSEGHIATECLPPYAPELNPVEYIWAYWKQHELPNVCPKDYWELDERARKSLRRMRRKPRLITAFWKQSSLGLDQLDIMRDSITCSPVLMHWSSDAVRTRTFHDRIRKPPAQMPDDGSPAFCRFQT